MGKMNARARTARALALQFGFEWPDRQKDGFARQFPQ